MPNRRAPGIDDALANTPASTPKSATASIERSRSLRELVTPYARPSGWRGVVQLLGTGLPYLTLMAAMLVGLAYNVWAALLVAVPAALCLVRLFMIQHDCGHGSFFKARWANDLVGTVLGVLTLTPYVDWQRCHAAHHATTGNLDRRGIGDITTMTVREYLQSSGLRRIGYRLGRHPLVLFGVGPAYQFLLRHRVPGARQFRRLSNWLSALGTNAAIAALVAGLAFVLGWKPVLLGMVPVTVLAATIGIWLFYVQHQFEETYWETGEHWNFDAAALEGSSFYDLPHFLHWLTAYIGFHHIHHLSSKVPNYRLHQCFRENPPLHSAKRVTIRESLRCPRLALWDEKARRLVPFKALRRR